MITVTIPTVGHSPLLPALLAVMSHDDIPVRLAVNRRDRLDAVRDLVGFPPHAVWVRDGWTLYQVWNEAMRGDGIAVILNDDVQLQPGAVHALVAAMGQDERVAVCGFDYRTPYLAPLPVHAPLRYVRGTYRLGGVGGFAFAVRCRYGLQVDERFQWWGGDDDLVYGARQRGLGVAVAEGVGVGHPAPQSSAVHYPELLEATAADRALCLEKWGESW